MSMFLFKKVQEIHPNIKETKIMDENLKTVLIRNRNWSERRDPDNFSCFSTQEWCSWEFPEFALKNEVNIQSVKSVQNAEFDYDIMWLYTSKKYTFENASLFFALFFANRICD